MSGPPPGRGPRVPPVPGVPRCHTGTASVYRRARQKWHHGLRERLSRNWSGAVTPFRAGGACPRGTPFQLAPSISGDPPASPVYPPARRITATMEHRCRPSRNDGASLLLNPVPQGHATASRGEVVIHDNEIRGSMRDKPGNSGRAHYRVSLSSSERGFWPAIIWRSRSRPARPGFLGPRGPWPSAGRPVPGG